MIEGVIAYGVTVFDYFLKNFRVFLDIVSNTEERGFGVDISSDYNVRGELTVGSYGHTGFTGTSIWLDPANDLFVVLLTNGVHGKPPAKVTAVRRRLHAAVSRARND